MPIKDIFSYSSRWDSVGLDCQHCQHFSGPQKWPDNKKSSFCQFHKVSLKVEIAENGYKEYEWFCKDFSDKGTADKAALNDFESIKGSLKLKILYRLYGGKGELLEYDMKTI